MKNSFPRLCPASCVIFAVTILWFGLFALGGVDPHHDGIMLKPAADVATGQILFRDTFTQYGLLTVFLQALAIKIGGATVLAVRLSTVLFYAMSAVLLYRIWSRLLNPGYVWGVMILFWILPGFCLSGWIFLPWSSVYALFFMLLMTECIFNVLKTERKIDWYFIGAAGAAAFWCRQTYGVTLVAAGIFAVLLHWRQVEQWKVTLQRLLRLVGGALLFSALPVMYLLVWGAFEDWCIQSIRFAFRFGKTGGVDIGGLPEVWLPLQLILALFPIKTSYVLFPVLTLLFFVYSIIGIWKKKAVNWFLLAVALVALASWHQYFPVGCPRHWYWAATPMFGFFVLTIQNLVAATGRRMLRFSAIVLLTLLLVPTILERINGMVDYCRNFSQRRQIIQAPMGGIFLEPGAYNYWQAVQKAFDSIPPQYNKRAFVNLTDSGLYNLYFPEQKNFHPMYINWGAQVYGDYPEKLKLFLNDKQPVAIFYSNKQPRKSFMFFRIKNRNVDLYLLIPPQ
ncbi:MAG: glycosyltransferase family 39 protein [Victivallaceae bacterium]